MWWNLGQTVLARAGDPTADKFERLCDCYLNAAKESIRTRADAMIARLQIADGEK
jgi:hypothetical protein